MSESLVGEELGSCRILEKLGQGGMGVVYKARHLRLERTVVVKVLNHDLSTDEEYLKGFRREATAAAQLEHPGIVQVYDRGSEGERHFIVMQFIDGETLADYLEREKRLAPVQAVRILRAVLKALAEAHRHGIVHRDVKPSNILLGKDGSIRLSDFGIAVQLGRVAGAEETRIFGTPLYMAPEQAWGGEVDRRCDIYAMGVTFYHMLAGEPPFDSDNPADIIAMHVNDPPPDVRSAAPGVSKLAADLIMKMMAKRPEERVRTVEDILEELNSPGIVLEETGIVGERTLDLGIAPPQKPLPRLRPSPIEEPEPVLHPPPEEPADEHRAAPRRPARPGLRASAAACLLATAGCCAYLGGLRGSYVASGAALVLAASAWWVSPRGLGLLAPSLLLFGLGMLHIAGIMKPPLRAVLDWEDWRAHLLPLGVIAVANGMLLSTRPERDTLDECVLWLSLAAAAVSLHIFALPGQMACWGMLDSAVRHGHAIPLAALAVGLLAISPFLGRAVLGGFFGTLLPLSLILSGASAAYASGAVHHRPPRPKAQPAAQASRPSHKRKRQPAKPARRSAEMERSPGAGSVMVFKIEDGEKKPPATLKEQKARGGPQRKRRKVRREPVVWSYSLKAPLAEFTRRLARAKVLLPMALWMCLLGLVPVCRWKPPD